MRKMIVLLLVVGLIIGTFTASERLGAKDSFQEDTPPFGLKNSEYTTESTTPCDGGGTGSGAGGGTPG